MGYATRVTVYAIGLQAEAFARPAIAFEGVTPGAGVIARRGHGLSLDEPLTLAALSSSTLGAPAAALPAGLAVGVLYYARPVGSDLFAVALAPSPTPAIASFGDAGAGLLGFIVDHGPYLDAALDAASAIIDQYARAHAAPIAAAILPFLCAYLAVRIYAGAHAANNPTFAAALDGPRDGVIRGMVDKLFAVYMSGSPILGAVDATPSTADNGAKLVQLAPGPFGLCDGVEFRA